MVYLLEVLVAMTIVGLGVVTLLQIFRWASGLHAQLGAHRGGDLRRESWTAAGTEETARGIGKRQARNRRPLASADTSRARVTSTLSLSSQWSQGSHLEMIVGDGGRSAASNSKRFVWRAKVTNHEFYPGF
jgi:hypothetical protein